MILATVNLAIPPAAKVLAVIGSVYALITALKKVPVLTRYMTGTVSIVVNVIMTVCGLLVAVQPDQLYTLNTLVLIVTTVLGSAGIHGTVKSLSAPQVLAIVPPSKQVEEVPATLVPDNPSAVPVDPK